MLRPVGGKKQEFGDRRNRFLGLEKRLAQPASKRCSARFAGGDNVDRSLAQRAREHTELGRLSTSVDPFKSNKFSLQIYWLDSDFRSCEIVEIECLNIKTSC